MSATRLHGNANKQGNAKPQIGKEAKDASLGLDDPSKGDAGIPKGYKWTEVGVIPEDWEVKQLRKISPAQSVGLVINPSSYFNDQGTVPMLVGSNIGENVIDWEFAKRISAESNVQIPASRLSAGDLVTVRVGEPGVTSVVPPEIDGCNCASMMIIRKHQSFDSNWLCFVMNSSVGRCQVANVQYGTAQKQFNISDAVRFAYPVPPLVEQRAIAKALLDTDCLIEALETLIAKKRAIKQAAMQQLLAGKTRLPGFSGAWRKVVLGEHVTYLRNGVNARAELTNDGSIKYLHYGDIHTSNQVRLDPQAAEMPRLSVERAQTLDRLRNGDLVFVDASEDLDGVGKSLAIYGISDAQVVAGLHTIAARFDKSVIADGFKAYLQFCPAFRDQLKRLAAGTKVFATNRTHISSAKIRLPDTEEQTAIATVLSDMDTEIAALERRRDKTRAIKQGMMQQLLTGRIRLVEPKAKEAP